MKINYKHFKFTWKSRRFKQVVWDKYLSLKKKEKLTEYDKHWIKEFRTQLKTEQLKLSCTHVPSGISSSWTIKKTGINELLIKKAHFTQMLSKVRYERAKTREIVVKRKVFDGAEYATNGGVFDKPGIIPTLSEKLNSNNPLATKKPRQNNKNYIGIELEFNAISNGPGKNDIAQKLKNAGLAKFVDVTTDGSCGWEVRVLVLEDNFIEPLTNIMNVLTGMGFSCNDACGTHVHLDMRSRDVNVAYANLFKAQKFLRKFLTKKRKRNSFCKINTGETFEAQKTQDDRYYGINVQSFDRHKTLEVRMHQGTLNPKELIPWIELLTRVVNYKTVLDSSVNTMRQAKMSFKIEADLAKSLELKLLDVFHGLPTAESVATGPLGIRRGFSTVLSNIGL
jgi:Putative amidoligase enzyme